jgi:hypothetical protein
VSGTLFWQRSVIFSITAGFAHEIHARTFVCLIGLRRFVCFVSDMEIPNEKE